jgi:hypothetical protein
VTDQIPDPAALNQVTAILKNTDGTQNIYITQDPAMNALTLTLTNGLSDTIVFPRGTPTAYDKLPPGQSAVYIYLNGLIDNADIARFQPSALNWAADTFTDPSSRQQYLVIAPESQVTVPPGQALTFQLANVRVQGSPSHGTADIALAGTNVTGLTSDARLFVNVVDPPPPGDQVLPVEIGFDTPVVYTGQPQSLILRLVNKLQTAPLVPDGSKAWQGKTPTFQLTLVYGDDSGALTTGSNAARIGMGIYNDYDNVWHLPQRNGQVQDPYWIMQPDINRGGTVLGAGEHASIEFDITGIEATLPQGLDHALTLAYVSWYDIPGYKPGWTTLIITKKAGPWVNKFTTDPPLVPPGGPAVLTWDVWHATGVHIEAPQVDPTHDYPLSGSGPTPPGAINVPLGTTVTLIAYKNVLSDRKVTAGGVRQPQDDVITATAQLRITGVSRTDVSASIGSLGAIVIPAHRARAFLFQMNSGRDLANQLTKAAILDTSTKTITGTVDLESLIPSPGGGIVIQDAVPSPDGGVIHVLVSSVAEEKYYVLPLDVSAATYGRPVSKGSLGPWASPGPRLLATPDGRTVFASVWGGSESGKSYVYAFDAATYESKGSWTWEPDRTNAFVMAVASNADGSVLLMSGTSGPAVIDVADGFTQKARLSLNQVIRKPLVSPDVTRAYYLCAPQMDPTQTSLVAVDVNPGTGTLRTAKVAKLKLNPDVAHAAALSPDAGTLYMLTSADTVTAIDTTTFAGTPYPCGINGQFRPLVIAAGPQAKVLYSLTSSDTVSILTLP